MRRTNTTPDMLFTVETVSCLGACGLAPVVVINDEVHGRMTPQSSGRAGRCDRRTRRVFDDSPQRMARDQSGRSGSHCRRLGNAVARLTRRVIICAGTGCMAGGAIKVHGEFVAQITAARLPVTIDLKPEDGRPHAGLYVSKSGCQGSARWGRW